MTRLHSLPNVETKSILTIQLGLSSWSSAVAAGNHAPSSGSLILGFIYAALVLVGSYLREKKYIKNRWLILVFWVWPLIAVVISHLLET